MAVDAVVREWHDEDGWGVLDSPSTPGGCWAHFSAVAADGYRTLSAGDRVLLEHEAARQDGYTWRAVRVWAADTVPVDPPPSPPGEAYRSTLVITFDDDEG
ncbi:cold-shock protein [Blastococcus sp. URHD0036]|uniref:cold-shock protein n=1 Tax=Blastococcus sp. URHD0036 TaxID=1380356 RepID=UPI00049587DB|nr:cold shock domain-containing protein [Blastococcus sp. URHD0036]